MLGFGLLCRDASLEADAGDPGTRDVKTGSFPSMLSLPDRRPELRAELGARAELEPEAWMRMCSSIVPRGGASLLNSMGLGLSRGYDTITM